jgi:hypothetical protein
LRLDEVAEVLTFRRAAELSGVGVRLLRRAARSGELPLFQVGAWQRVRWRDVLCWLEAQRVPATPHAKQRVREIMERRARRQAAGAIGPK